MNHLPYALIVSLLFFALSMVIMVVVDYLTAKARLKALAELAAMQDRPAELTPIKIDERI